MTKIKKGFAFAFIDKKQAQTYINFAADAGFETIEPTFLEKGFPAYATFRDDCAELRRMCEARGLRIVSMRGGPMFWPRFASPDATRQNEIRVIARHALEALQIMGADTLLAVPGQWETGNSYAQALETIRSNGKWLGEVAEEMKLTVGLENVQNRLLLSPGEWCQMIDSIGHPRIRMYFDVGNVLWLRLGQPQDWLREIGGQRICRVHFKDAVESTRLVPLLEGEVNWRAVRQALREINYTSWVHAELDPYPLLPERLLEKTAKDMDAIWNLE